MTNNEVIDNLQKATEGLLCCSESEYPFDVLLWESPELLPLTETKLLMHTNHPENTDIKLVEVDDFFRLATTEEAWYSSEEKQIVNKYRALVKTLKNCLSDVKVYRLGNVEIDVYIIGLTPAGNLAGLSTKLVET